jgi:gluconokinase
MDHFMPPSLLDSQIAALEPPGEDENVLLIRPEGGPADIADDVIARLGLTIR